MSKAIKRVAVQTMRRRVAAEQVEEEDAALTFADVDPERESEASSADDDDFEAKARRFKQRLMQENMDAEMEQQEHSKRRSAVAPLADAERVGVEDQHSAAELTARVEETIKVLTNFGVEREDGRTREEYLELLRHDLAELFEYNDFLMGCIVDLFPPQEAYEFLRKMDQERPVTIRTNTLKAKRRDLVQILTKKGAHVEPLEKWSKVGLQVFESNVPIAGTVEYLAGHYMLQSAVSFIPVLGMTPQEHERILDMSAAPGGKTTYIAQLMQNTGVLFANDVNEDRCKALNANIQRLGISNCIVTHYDGVGYERVARGFDRVLLDAPCTGTGVISRDKSIKTSKTLADVQRTSELQRRMILSAIDCVSAKSATGGIVVYSTCSFLVEENEAVIDYALRKRYVRVEPIEVGFGRPGLTKYRHHRFHPDVALSLRFFPHVHNMDGFYVCRLRKYKDGPRDDDGAAAVEDAATAAAEAAKARKEKANSVKAKRAAKVAAAKAPDAGNGRVSIPPQVTGKKRTGAKAAKDKAAKKAAKKAEKKAAKTA